MICFDITYHINRMACIAQRHGPQRRKRTSKTMSDQGDRIVRVLLRRRLHARLKLLHRGVRGTPESLVRFAPGARIRGVDLSEFEIRLAVLIRYGASEDEQDALLRVVQG